MTWTGTRIQELKMVKHIQGRTNSIKCENMVALICLLKPLTKTAQKVVPHGGYCHTTLKLGMNAEILDLKLFPGRKVGRQMQIVRLSV